MSLNINNNNTLIIFDWDDTLFPTKWFIKNKINLELTSDKIKYGKYFEYLDSSICKLLNLCNKLGHVIIITNAMPEWIYTSVNILPKTKKIIKNLKIVSARKNYQNMCNITEWKKMAFEKENNKKFINIISIGDAMYEYNALINLHDTKNNVLLKSVKFVSDPSNLILLDQIQVLGRSIDNICISPKHFDLNFK